MKTFRSIFTRSIAAANEADAIAVANALGGEAVFQLQQDGRLFVPYGEYPHPKGRQLFNRESAEIMVGVFNSLGSKIARFFTSAGAPVYVGHPDVPGRADSNPAAPAFGWIKAITAANDGGYFDVEWNEDGDRAVRNKHFRFYSPHWNCRSVKGGIQPVQLLSIGLTNNPRIPVPAITNDQTNHDMKLTELLRKLLGIPAENDAPTDAQIDEAVTALETRIATLTSAANDATAAQTAAAASLVTITGERDALQGQLTAAQNDLTAANDRVTAERTARVEAHLADFTTSGRVTAAERDALRTELVALENDALATRIEAIGKTKPKLNTQGVGEIGGTRKVFAAANDEAARSEQRREAIDTELSAVANDRTFAGMSAAARYDKAFNRASKKHPDLFPTKAKTA